MEALRIGLVGYGEVGKILGHALVERKVAWVGAWDRLLRDPAQAPAMRTHAIGAGVEPMASLAALLERADFVIRTWPRRPRSGRTGWPG
jgi:phosphoglycerate dehydrogenase-like enzyme